MFEALAEPDAHVSRISYISGLHRPTVYAALDRLIAAGIVTKRKKGKRTVYRRGSKQALSRLLNIREHENKKALAALKGACDNQDNGQKTVDVLQGKEGLRQVLEMLINNAPKDGTFYRISSRSASMNIEPFIPKQYRIMRDKKGIQQFVIVNHGLRNGTYKKRVDALSKMVPLKEDRFEYGVNMLIFNGKLAIVNFETETAYIIHDKNVANLQRALFKLIFNRLTI